MKKIVFAAGVAALALVAAASASTFVQPESTRLRIATEGAFAPWNATTPDGKLIGFEIDLANDLCRRLQATCDIVAQDWDGILPGLMQGRYDAVMAGVSITDERAKAVDFSAAYAADPAVFATRAGSPLSGVFPGLERVDLAGDAPSGRAAVATIANALRGKTVGVQVSTIHATMMEALFPGVAVRTYGKLDEAAFDLAAGRLDTLLGARSSVEAIGKAGGDLVAVGPAFSRGVLGHGVAAAVRKGDALSARLTHAIAEAAQDGTTARLSDRWFGFDVSIR